MGVWELEDGKEYIENTWITTKVATAMGLVGSAYHLLVFQPENTMAGVLRAGNVTLSMAALGAIFGTVTCLSAQIRDTQDDPVNFMLGGCASGIFLGARAHSAMTGTTACLALGALGYFSKVGKKEGWRLYGDPKL